MLILGLSPFKRDAAAALLSDGSVKAAIENDKLVRSRTAGLPDEAARFCLRQASATWHDLDTIAVATRPLHAWLRRSTLRGRVSPLRPVATAYHEATELGALVREISQIRSLHQNNGTSPLKIRNFDHHLCHAASAFYASPFDRSIILTLDEEGDGVSGTVAVGEGNRIRVLRTIPFPHSLGWVYSQITELLGFTAHHDEHKTQWLSMDGEPDFRQTFLELFRNPQNHLPRLNFDFFNHGFAGRLPFSNKFYKGIGLPKSDEKLSDDHRRALASSLQNSCTKIITGLVEFFRAKTGISQVCLGGGLFQNALLVAALEKNLGFDQVFVPPAPGNAGCAYGAALLVWHQEMGKPRSEPVTDVYWGPAFSRSEIKDVLDNCKARYSLQTTEERKLDAAIQLLEAGKIVGWFQGATEFGPRALGNRSLLASPWAPYVRENLNDYIKHREWFRPFALAVPEEDCARYFECSSLCRSMNSLAWIRPEQRDLPDGFALPGGRVRLHVVQEQSNPQLWRLLRRFGKTAPAPILVNTSFNLFGEPLVVKPRDAVRSYFCSGIDALVIDNFMLAKGATHFFSAKAS